jgi:hypothetical protein
VLTSIAIVYAAGVVVGLLRVDAPPGARLLIALSWPLGIAAGVVTITVLLLAAMVRFPMVGAAVVAGALLVSGWWLTGGG